MQKINNTNTIYDIAIIGAGASGLMLASQLSSKYSACIIDTNDRIGEKLKVCGGGKCNITNKTLSSDNYQGESDFIASVLDKFDNNNVINFFENNGVSLNIADRVVKGQYFAKSSSYILDMFVNLISHHKLFLNTTILEVKYIDEVYEIISKNKIIKCKKLIVASGGLSFTNLGASNLGYEIASQFGHTFSKTSASLVGYTVQKDEFWFKTLSGLSLYINIDVNGKLIDGNILFAHKGCSGPAIMNSSVYWKKGNMEIDFLPNDTLDKYIKSNALISSALPLPKRFIKEFLIQIGLEDKPMSKLSKDELEKLKLLKKYSFAPAGTFGYTKAEVTRGGINTNEINVNNMESKLQKNLYFLGEVLDVTGELGGYNLQWAFSTAYICAKSLK